MAEPPEKPPEEPKPIPHTATAHWHVTNEQFRYLAKTGEFEPPAVEQAKG